MPEEDDENAHTSEILSGTAVPPPAQQVGRDAMSESARPTPPAGSALRALARCRLWRTGAIGPRCPTSQSDTTQATTAEGILEAPTSSTLGPFATRCPISAPGTTPSGAVWAILEAPILAPSANRYAMSDFRVLEHAVGPAGAFQGWGYLAQRGDRAAMSDLSCSMRTRGTHHRLTPPMDDVKWAAATIGHVDLDQQGPMYERHFPSSRSDTRVEGGSVTVASGTPGSEPNGLGRRCRTVAMSLDRRPSTALRRPVNELH
jgi:hypothetical protein